MSIIRNSLMTFAAAAAFTAAGASVQAADIKVGAASNVGGMIVFVAQGKGFFAKHGLNAKVVVRNTGSALTKSLRAGEIDFAPAAFTNLPVALEKGFKLRGVVGYLGGHYSAPTSDGNVGIIARPGTGIKSIKDLKGKKVGVAFGTTGAQFYLSLGAMPCYDLGLAGLAYWYHSIVHNILIVVFSSMDSGLEAFSRNPAHGSFSALTFPSTEFANCANQRFLSY